MPPHPQLRSPALPTEGLHIRHTLILPGVVAGFAAPPHGLIDRYAPPELRAVWSDENRIRLWLQVEVAVAQALAGRWPHGAGGPQVSVTVHGPCTIMANRETLEQVLAHLVQN
ncbi:MAG: hypothetical protein ACP5PW_05410, partial [Candidatus Dormibacteria bacterium]